MNRRSLLKSGAGLLAGVSLISLRGLGVATAADDSVEPLPQNWTRTWIGPAYWANRLQDWRLNDGAIECVPMEGERVGRTVSVLTHELVAGRGSCRIAVRTGVLQAGAGFSAILIGAGGGEIDHRGAALVQAAAGIGGGLLCTYEHDGRVCFRDHARETGLFYGMTPATVVVRPKVRRRTSEDVLLELKVDPSGTRFKLTLSAYDFDTGELLARSYRLADDPQIIGGIGLMSSSINSSLARYWFRDLSITGGKVAEHPERAEGPIFAAQYSLNDDVLKLSAHLFPIADQEQQFVFLEVRQQGGAWQRIGRATIKSGYVAHFRIDGWDGRWRWDYRVIHAAATARRHEYYGEIVPHPQGDFAIGMISCVTHSFRALDRPSNGTQEIPNARLLGLYTKDNLYFPYDEIVESLAQRQCQLLVTFGDQYYEARPTVRPTSKNPDLDFIYRYYLWLWSFRELTRVIPSLTLIDDHDVYQGNIYGNGGTAADSLDGYVGYARSPEWVNMVQSVQCGHNPDPYDPTPVRQGISVYYCAFRFGQVSFALIEDRKWKTLRGAPSPQLLGARQEKFLADWATMYPKLPRICLTQTSLASISTQANGTIKADPDTSAAPRDGHDRAVDLLRKANALVLCGDQHLATLARLGIDTYDDGPLQFAAPATGSSYPRWFEPAGSKSYTGRFVDGFGNRMHVLAVANPPVSQKTYLKYYPSPAYGIGDRNLKADGFGVVDVRVSENAFVLECWPWDQGPASANPQQYAGWPYQLAFGSA